ncbi:MAG TPA: 3-oxoacyl-ACP synthase III [Candidatus Obscuribacterales bacterium]
MFYENVNILGMGNVDAPHRVTSLELEEPLAANLERFGMRPRLIESLTGIVARRFWDPGLQPSKYATRAAVRALEDARLPKDKLGVMINCSISKDYIEPSVASLIHNNLELPTQCMNFDVSNACLGFLNGMLIAGNMIERGQVDYALLTACESTGDLSRVTVEQMARPDVGPEEFRDRFATLTLGSAAVAMVLARKDLAPDGHAFLGGVSMAATQHSNLCVGQNEDMKTDAKALLVAGMELSAKTWARACEEMDWHKKEFSQYIMHQVGEAHLRQLVQTLGINDERVPKIYAEYGNTGSCTLPQTLFKTLEEGKISKGDRVALMGIGSGINCALMEVIW